MKKLGKVEELAREMRKVFDNSYEPNTYAGEEWIRNAMLRLARWVLRRDGKK